MLKTSLVGHLPESTLHPPLLTVQYPARSGCQVLSDWINEGISKYLQNKAIWEYVILKINLRYV